MRLSHIWWTERRLSADGVGCIFPANILVESAGRRQPTVFHSAEKKERVVTYPVRGLVSACPLFGVPAEKYMFPPNSGVWWYVVGAEVTEPEIRALVEGSTSKAARLLSTGPSPIGIEAGAFSISERQLATGAG